MLVFGALFLSLSTPKQAEASFLTSILNTEVFASAPNISQFSNNSQTMALLQANVSSLPALEDKKKEENKVDTTATVNIVSDTALLPATSPLGAIAGGDAEDFSFDQTSIYIVRSGDTVSTVAEMFGVSESTILAANDMKKGDKLKEGDVLLILPLSGIEHTVTKGQTLKSIAASYKVDLSDILFANDLDVDTMLVVGEKLIIPGIEIQDEPSPKPKTKNLASTKGKTTNKSLPSVSGYFKNPVPGARRSRGLQAHHHGVDLAAPAGTPIYAAASGNVLISRMGFNGGFGNYAVIQHSNGCKTLYAHMSKLATNPGEAVSQGEVIGYVGSTGHSTGNHLHIETPGCRNPF